MTRRPTFIFLGLIGLSCVTILFAQEHISGDSPRTSAQQATSTPVADSELVRNGPGCALDPTYQYFERIQKREYLKNPVARKYLDRTVVADLLKEKETQLNQRPNSGNRRQYSQEELAELEKQLNVTLPTCYEDILIHSLVSKYIAEVERARKALTLPEITSPKYGILPIPDINAATYPSTENTDSIIGFNAQLFMFDYEMAKVVLPLNTLSIDRYGQSIPEISLKSVEQRLRQNHNIEHYFFSALLEFMLLTSQEDRPIDAAYDEFVISLTIGMELFGVGHEYGHLIKGHSQSGKTTLLLVEGENNIASDDVNVPVVLHSWAQEFEADDVGLMLEIEVLRNSPVFHDPLRWLYVLYGAEFYFQCMDVVDQARYIRDHGRAPKALTPVERSYLQLVGNGTAPDKDTKRFARLLLSNHPPAWLRLERIKRAIDKYVGEHSIPNDVREYARLGPAVINELELLWKSNSQQLPSEIQEARKAMHR